MFWKIYFWVFCVILAIGYIAIKLFDAIYIVDLIISLPSLVGLFLYAYKKRWLDVRFWRVYVPIYLFWDIYMNFVILPKVEGKSLVGLESILVFVFLFPIWIALCLYAFKFLNENPDLKVKSSAS